MIFSPFRWRPTAIRDFFAKSLKIQIAACYLWHRPLGEVDAHSSLLSAACNLFQQVVYIFCSGDPIYHVWKSEYLT